MLDVCSDEELIRRLLERLGENPNRGGLKETPERVIKAWKFFCSGYEQKPEDVLKTFEDGGEKYDELLFQANIPVFSNCEHHLQNFFGVAHIAYVPNGRVVGLSKLSRLVEVFSRRLQIQERLTQQIADSLMEHLKPVGVGVVLQMRHMCMEARGIQKVGTATITSALRGCVKNESDCRSEFMAMVVAASNGMAKL